MVALTLSFLNLYTQYNRPQKIEKCESTTCTNVNAFVVPKTNLLVAPTLLVLPVLQLETYFWEDTTALYIHAASAVYSIFLITDI